MKALIFRAALAAAGVTAAGVLGAAPAVADGPTVINAHCDDQMVSQPAMILPNCSNQAIKLTGMRWFSWSGDRATGFGDLVGPRGAGPVFVVLDQPRPQMSGQNAFTHAGVQILAGPTLDFAISPMWAQ
jgi:hypothetical protein